MGTANTKEKNKAEQVAEARIVGFFIRCGQRREMIDVIMGRNIKGVELMMPLDATEVVKAFEPAAREMPSTSESGEGLRRTDIP